MTNEEPLRPEHWRIFRIFLASLSEEELDFVEDQLKKEQLARQERETIIVRLFAVPLTDRSVRRMSQ